MEINTLTSVSLTSAQLFWLVVLFVWSFAWKGVAWWKSARRNHLTWFIIFFVVNLAGILEILYIFLFADMNKKKRRKK